MNLLSGMSGSLKGVVTVMALMLPIVMIAGMQNPKMLVWFMGIYIVLGVVATLLAMMADKKKKKKAEQFSEDVEGNAADVGANKAAEDQARVDDLRQEFQRGLDIYSQYGKDIYSLPWYVVVGESGSGKTEMIRRSEIGLPDKLQQFWQGSGGTLSMHWWFTNHAVIIDTAGKLFLDDSSDPTVAQGSDKPWREFLQMLRRNRSDCPINGLCLVIPATSLAAQADASDEESAYREIDRRAGQISSQMEVLRAELGVRFPVYLIVTKTDLVVGFREFFDAIESPEERYQILGWSNPAPLDQAVRPKVIGEHLSDVADRLRKRRMAVMKDPVPRGRNKTQLDNIDAMYELPRSLEAMAPKLERYLSNIFSKNQWSSDPPFLRGVYFTSSLQQGGVLDSAMAAALGIDVNEYQTRDHDEDLSLSKNKTYFLRDLFLEKIFQEKGLVVKQGKSTKTLRGWKFWIPTFLVTSLLLVLGLGYLTGMSKPAELKRWEALNDKFYRSQTQGFVPIIKQENAKWKWEQTKTRDEMLKTLDGLGASDLSGPPKMGWLFGVASRLDGDIKEDRKEAYRVAVDGIILKPLVSAMLNRLEVESRSWSTGEMSDRDENVLEDLLDFYQGSDLEELEDQLVNNFNYVGAELRRGRNDRETREALVNSVKVAYPEGVKVSDYFTDDKKQQLVGILDVVFSVDNDRGILDKLARFETLWKKVPSLEDGQIKDHLTELSIASGVLIPLKSQITAVLDAGEEEEGSPKNQFGKQLVANRVELLEDLAPDKIDGWEKKADSDGSMTTGEKKQLSGLASQFQAHENMVSVLEKWSTFDFNGNGRLPNPLDPEKAPEVREALKTSLEEAKALKIDPPVIEKFFSFGLNGYIEKMITEKISFPLIDLNNLQGRDELSTVEAGSMTLMALALNQTADEVGLDSNAKLAEIIRVGQGIFDPKELEEGKIKVVRLKIEASTNEYSFCEKVVLHKAVGDDWDDSELLTLKGGPTPRLESMELPLDAKFALTSYDSEGAPMEMISKKNAETWMIFRESTRLPPTMAGRVGVYRAGGEGSLSIFVGTVAPKGWPGKLMLLEDFIEE